MSFRCLVPSFFSTTLGSILWSLPRAPLRCTGSGKVQCSEVSRRSGSTRGSIHLGFQLTQRFRCSIPVGFCKVPVRKTHGVLQVSVQHPRWCSSQVRFPKSCRSQVGFGKVPAGSGAEARSVFRRVLMQRAAASGLCSGRLSSVSLMKCNKFPHDRHWKQR